MENIITGKYFKQNDFSQREKEVLEQILKETGFKPKKEIFRGIIYEKNKVGSLIYKGEYKKKSAVLKLQGLEPEIDEVEMINKFMRQNMSLLVRAPILYFYKKWSKGRGYGFQISEYINAPKIFEMPFATKEEMEEFGKFYQDYRTLALTIPWLKPATKNSLEFTLKRIENWRKISEYKKRLKKEDYIPFLEKFDSLAKEHFLSIPLIFCHRHITANDIYKMSDNSFVLFSNLFWSYCSQWYELAFNIWACMQHIRNIDYSFKEWINYVEKWRQCYYQIPVVKKDKDFDRKLNIILLERTMGAILVDIGVNDFYDKPENKKYFRHLLKLHQQFFNYLVEKLI